MAIKAGCEGGFDGICCRMVVEVKRVFDGCRSVEENVALALTTREDIPADAEITSVRIVSSELAGYTVESGCGSCRVCGEVVTQFAIAYTSGGEQRTVRAVNRRNREFCLKLPDGDSLIPYSIEVSSFMNIASVAVVGAHAVTVYGCLVQLVKVTAPVDILIPTYGYCKYPPCCETSCPGAGGRIFPGSDG